MLRPSAFSFAKTTPAADAQDPETVQPDVTKASEPPLNAEKEDTASEKANPVDDDHLTMLTKNNGLAKSNPFTAVQVTPLSSSSGFVFGQNVRDRVTGNVDDEGTTTSSSSGAAGGAGEMNGDLLFSAAIPDNGGPVSAADEDGGAVGNKGGGRSLSDVAREYEENKNARKRKFEEVETFTGEEDEINVLDVRSRRLLYVCRLIQISSFRSLVNCTPS